MFKLDHSVIITVLILLQLNIDSQHIISVKRKNMISVRLCFVGVFHVYACMERRA